ncbi:hypothetical protein BDV34DRAFT_1404 [Aspergillus parasiticus]|uniref:Uncharacterized protein n=1 Tax=Aspergillus parasiticus TaxID=5067 RepID=A0A5N6E4J1_ASPPA|nr:hypothetical protein BDV34DRAFT_1404 [Aspergillus parasiticus]
MAERTRETSSPDRNPRTSIAASCWLTSTRVPILLPCKSHLESQPLAPAVNSEKPHYRTYSYQHCMYNLTNILQASHKPQRNSVEGLTWHMHFVRSLDSACLCAAEKISPTCIVIVHGGYASHCVDCFFFFLSLLFLL